MINEQYKKRGKVYPFDENLIVYPDGNIWNIKKNNWQAKNRDQQGRYKCNANGNNRLVYRLVMLTHNFREDHQNLHVHHMDGDKTNDRLENLYWLPPKSHSEIHLGMKRKKI